jgi:hypothetical protein
MGGASGVVDEEEDQEKSRSFYDEYGPSVPFNIARRIRSRFIRTCPIIYFGSLSNHGLRALIRTCRRRWMLTPPPDPALLILSAEALSVTQPLNAT